jgi:citrate lyase subunit beta/citryl-CoA lyase
MPGSNERALEKAKTIAVDALIFDLEDAVAPDAKPLARDQVCAAVKNGGYGGREVVIRVNALETPWGTEDLLAACDAEPDAILVPKVMHPGDIISVAKILQGVHAPEKIRLWAMMETPMARTIAAIAVYEDNRLCCLVMGTNDLIKESRARALHDRFAVEGRMVERLHLGMAERTVTIAEQIRQMEVACAEPDQRALASP